MLREHEPHVPSVDVSDTTSDEDSWTDFIARVDGHDRTLFAEGLDLTTANPPEIRPKGILGQLYDAREGTPGSHVIDSLWRYQGIAPIGLIANEAGLLPGEIPDKLNGINGYYSVKIASEVADAVSESAKQANPNVQVILEAVESGDIDPNNKIVISRPLASFYGDNQYLSDK